MNPNLILDGRGLRLIADQRRQELAGQWGRSRARRRFRGLTAERPVNRRQAAASPAPGAC